MASNSFQFTHLSANAATIVIKGGPAILHSISINTKGASANLLTVYNNASAASGAVIAALDTTTNTQTYFYDCVCTAGITVSLATGTAADLTICWE